MARKFSELREKMSSERGQKNQVEFRDKWNESTMKDIDKVQKGVVVFTNKCQCGAYEGLTDSKEVCMMREDGGSHYFGTTEYLCDLQDEIALLQHIISVSVYKI